MEEGWGEEVLSGYFTFHSYLATCHSFLQYTEEAQNKHCNKNACAESASFICTFFTMIQKWNKIHTHIHIKPLTATKKETFTWTVTSSSREWWRTSHRESGRAGQTGTVNWKVNFGTAAPYLHAEALHVQECRPNLSSPSEVLFFSARLFQHQTFPLPTLSGQKEIKTHLSHFFMEAWYKQ